MPNTIKFSADYEKLPLNWNGTFAKLVKIEPKRFSELDPAFVEFDSRYRGGVGHFEFTSKYDRVILLTFVHFSGVTFTTIRSYSADKLEYYLKNINMQFEMVRSYE